MTSPMFKLNIISKVEIEPVTQEQIEALITAKLQEQNPQVVIDSITFTQRRDPARIEATVDARLNTGAAISKREAAPFQAEPVKEEVVVAEPVSVEPTETEVDEELDLMTLNTSPMKEELGDEDGTDVSSIFSMTK